MMRPALQVASKDRITRAPGVEPAQDKICVVPLSPLALTLM